jgi:hypothetical protein
MMLLGILVLVLMAVLQIADIISVQVAVAFWIGWLVHIVWETLIKVIKKGAFSSL